LDRFKTINDSLGHQIGDQLLDAVAKRMQQSLRDADTISRLGGDEFIVLLPGTDATGAAHVAQKVLRAAAEPHIVGTYQLNITPSIGISLYPDDGDTAATLIKNADTAMYDAKAHGRNGYKFFTQSMNVAVVERLHLESGLREALSKEQFMLEYQPQIDIRSGKIIGAEALLRWRHPELGVIAPGRFIPIAEDTGLIVPIGQWVLFEACRQNRAWQTQGLAHIPVAVNISSQQFRTHLADTIVKILDQTGLDARYLELELTEGVVMHSTEMTLSTLRSLRAMGVAISIDDFGTGYSSLSYLKRFPINKLKIDRSFTRDIIVDPDDRAIATAIISMSHNLRLRVIAEGVETAEQLQVLREQGCDEAQGYFFSRPLPAAAFAETLRSGRETADAKLFF
jgi:diguanylate cyclase (GGDEF)-like protein